jgi:hypothetical protein
MLDDDYNPVPPADVMRRMDELASVFAPTPAR